MALVRCLGCGQAFEAMGHTVACPMCGVVMKISIPPPGMTGGMEARGESVVLPPSSPPAPPRQAASEPWLSDTARMWIGIVVGVLVFALFVDWFRMKITPAKKVVDGVAVEKMAQDLAEERVSQLKTQLEKAEAAARTKPDVTVAAPMNDQGAAGTGATSGQTSTQPASGAAVASAIPAGPKKGENWSASLNKMAQEQGVTTAPTSRPVRIAEYASLVGLVPARPKDAIDASVTDARIDQALRRGVEYFVGEFGKRQLKGADQYGETFAGVDAISLYALLTAGRSVRDERVRSLTPAVKNWLDGLKDLPMDGGKATYSRSLRISALGVFNRKEDRLTMDNDARWLLDSSVHGAFTYTKPPAGTQSSGWDNSNSQYGGLGLWAASDAGVRVPTAFWRDVDQHWTENQVQLSGGWTYQGNTGGATTSMTAAGVTMLMVARDQMAAEGSLLTTAGGPMSKALERGLEWLDEGEHAVDFNGSAYYAYTLYGLERAGLASGYKYFGKHDWYRELAKKAIDTQREDGSWEIGSWKPVDTAFHLLFLARGREPVFMGKLRFDGNWSNRPRDVAMLTRLAGKTLERAFNWQVLGTQRDWTDWTDAPVMLVTSDEAPNLTDADVAKLRNYALAGGLIFTHAENGSEKFNEFAARLAKRVFPEYPMTPLPATHEVYSALFPVQSPPPLSGVSNGSRLLMVHCPTDLTKQWGSLPNGKEKEPSVGAQMGVNLVVYATGKRDLRRRMDSAYVAERSGKSIATVPVARLRYDGNWDPEPWGWTRAARKFDAATGIGLDVKPVEIVALEPKTAPVAHLTGTAARSFTDAEVKVVREYVQGGGVLLIDACGGSPAFAESVRTSLLARAFPNATPAVVGTEHPLMGHGRAWMSEITKVLTRGDTSQARGMMVLNAGTGAVVFTDLDVSTGLLGTTASGVRGYEPTVAEKLVQNLVVWAIWPAGAPPEPQEETTTKPSGK